MKNHLTLTGTIIGLVTGTIIGLTIVACTPQQLAVVKSIADLAGEVCVEHDSTEVCLSKCQVAATAAAVSSAAP